MLRHLSLSALLFVLACPSPGQAQTANSPSFASRIKSFFIRGETPKPPVPAIRQTERPAMRPLERTAMTPPKTAAPPRQVTTRSGSLRQTGQENATPFMKEPFTPTYAPTGGAVAKQPPGILNPASARRLPAGSLPAQQTRMRDSSFSHASYETQPKKKTMGSWFRGLWPWGKKTPPQTLNRVTPASHVQEAMTPPGRLGNTTDPASYLRNPMNPATDQMLKQSTSIDPRKVYHGSKTVNPEQVRASKVNRGSQFNESGVPQSNTEFRGRKDSAF